MKVYTMVTFVFVVSIFFYMNQLLLHFALFMMR